MFFELQRRIKIISNFNLIVTGMKGIQLLQMYQTVLSDRAKENTESSERSSRLLVTPLWFVLISETTLE